MEVLIELNKEENQPKHIGRGVCILKNPIRVTRDKTSLH